MKSISSNGNTTSIYAAKGLATLENGRSQTRINKGFVAALFANILWGASFLASQSTLKAWGPFTASSLRFALATLLMPLVMFLLGQQIRIPKTLKAWTGIFLVAVTGFGFLYPMQLAGLKLISGGTSAAIMLISPLLVLVGGRFFLSESLTNQKLVAVALGIVGGIILLQSGGHGLSLSWTPEFLKGFLLTFFAAISLAASALATRKASVDSTPANITFWSMGIGTVLISGAACIFERQSFLSSFSTGTFDSWSSLLFLALVCSALCFYLWNYALSTASPKEIASTMHIKTPTAILLGVLVAHETINVWLIAGTSIVMVGLWLSQASGKGAKS